MLSDTCLRERNSRVSAGHHPCAEQPCANRAPGGNSQPADCVHYRYRTQSVEVLSKISPVREATSPVSPISNLRWEANGCRRLRKLHPRWNAWQSFCSPETSAHAGFLQAAETASVALQIKVVPLGVRNAEEIEPAIREFALLPKGGMIVAPHPMTRGHFIIDLAARYRLPSIYPFRFYARDGGLISYGIDQVDQFRRAATYVDRILHGTKPADLPVQQPTKYELVINLKTANSLGLAVPPMVLARADEVIESGGASSSRLSAARVAVVERAQQPAMPVVGILSGVSPGRPSFGNIIRSARRRFIGING